jgi:hypothetical protein
MFFAFLLSTVALVSSSSAIVTRSTNDFNLTISTIPEVIQGTDLSSPSSLYTHSNPRLGGEWQLEIKGPGPSFFKYMATLTYPNGTDQHLLYQTNFELNNSFTDSPTLPNNRTCMARDAFSGITVKTNGMTLNEVGTYKLTVNAVYYYGANGYEYNDPLGGVVCISPSFTCECYPIYGSTTLMMYSIAENHASNPILVLVTDNTASSSFSVTLPSPTLVQFGTQFTGMPFQTGIISTTSTASASIMTPSRNGSPTRMNSIGGPWIWTGLLSLASLRLL